MDTLHTNPLEYLNVASFTQVKKLRLKFLIATRYALILKPAAFLCNVVGVKISSRPKDETTTYQNTSKPCKHEKII